MEYPRMRTALPGPEAADRGTGVVDSPQLER